MSEVTIYAWRKRFGTLESVDVKRLRQLEVEIGRLKKVVTERDLEIEILNQVAAKNGKRARPSLVAVFVLYAFSNVSMQANRGSLCNLLTFAKKAECHWTSSTT